jgi:hypothetical protein
MRKVPQMEKNLEMVVVGQKLVAGTIPWEGRFRIPAAACLKIFVARASELIHEVVGRLNKVCMI